MVLTAVSTGLRRGELLALKWDVIDLEKGYLQVRRSLGQTKGNIALKAPKTKSSRRRISIPQFLTKALKSHKKEQMETRLQVGKGYNDQDMVFANLDGGWISPHSFSHAFQYRVKDVEFNKKKVRLHDLRHTLASQLLLIGAHPKVVSERLGHSSISITLDIYSHLLSGIDEEATNKIDEVLSSTLSFKN